MIYQKTTTENAATGYIMNRRTGVGTTSGYDTIANQLDQLYHDMKDGKLGVAATTGSWYVGITSVKTSFLNLVKNKWQQKLE